MNNDAQNTPVPRPVPGRPHTGLRPVAAVSDVPQPAEDTSEWGRVDETGAVSVFDGGQWRVVGEYPDGTAAEALSFFERKYADLAGEITLLEARHRGGGAAASELSATARALRERVEGAAAVGDLAALRERLDTLLAELQDAADTEVAAARAAVDEALAQRTALVEQMEALAARDLTKVQWKQLTAEVNALFEQWQSAQRNGPRLPKSAAQALWKRFRQARTTIDRGRREFYAELDEVHKQARSRKSRLIERAEALAPSGEGGIPAYRDLLDQWKAAGRAGKKADDALWARFKAAGDVLYAARKEREQELIEESKEKIAAKEELLEHAAPLTDEKDLSTARTRLTQIQRRWDEIGRIHPREQERALDERLRRVEQSVRRREDADWERNDPETQARADDMTRQLTDAITKLEAELAEAEAGGDPRAVSKARDALQARQSWLKALGG